MHSRLRGHQPSLCTTYFLPSALHLTLPCPASACSALVAATAMLPAAAAKAEEATSVASSRMSYSRFLEYLEMGRVKKVR